MKKFNVITWDFNRDELEFYDVLPYLRKEIKKKKYSDKKEFKKIITGASLYMYWSRCEYEVIIHGWPQQKNCYKLDVHEQVMNNIEIIVDILWDEIISK